MLKMEVQTIAAVYYLSVGIGCAAKRVSRTQTSTINEKLEIKIDDTW
jgi:hypothetical protein